MLKFYFCLLRAIPDISDKWDRLVKYAAYLLALIGLFNPEIARVVRSRWDGIPRLWALVPLVVFICYRLLRANYESFKNLEKERDESLAELAKLSNRSGPVVVASRYAKIESGPLAGHTGIFFRNDGEPAYKVEAITPIAIPGIGRLVIDVTPMPLRQGEGEISFPVFREDSGGSSLGSKLYDFMVQHDLDTITIPVTYRDAYGDDWQMNTMLIKDQMARSGITGSEGGIRVDSSIPTRQPKRRL